MIYTFSIDPALVAEAEQRASLEGRGFPTLVVYWETQLLGQDWETVLVLDYTIPLPPLDGGRSFNEVRIAAYTGQVPTKFLYFGSELTSAAPRVAPGMENVVAPGGVYQEYRLTEESCPVPYLDLISSTPRIYGNGAQDYYSPPIKVERFDATPGIDLIADNFPKITANLPPNDGALLTDPSEGHWQGARFVGTKRIAILRQGKVIGLLRRAGRAERDVVPPEVVRRDPMLDVRRDAWVAVDFGASSTVVAIGTRERSEIVRIGTTEPPSLPRDYETPSEVSFQSLGRVVKAWRERAILPLTVWGDLYVGFGARERVGISLSTTMTGGSKERAMRARATVAELASIPARIEAGKPVYLCGRGESEGVATLERPSAAVIDEEGIGPDDPFDPIELFAYYIGLFVNSRRRGLYLRYAVGMPTGWGTERRHQVLAQLRRGIYRSLPAGMVGYDDLDTLQVVDAGPNVLSFAAHAFKIFGIAPRAAEMVPFAAIDAGATETAIVCGLYREGSPDEVAAGFERVLEHVEPSVLSGAGAERLLHRLAYRVYAASATSMRSNDVPFEPPEGEPPVEGAEERLNSSCEALVNVRLLKDGVRPLLERSGPAPVPDMVQLFARDGRVRDVRVLIDRAALSEWLRDELATLAGEIKDVIAKGFARVTRNKTPYDELRVLLGGRLMLNAHLQERLEAALPKGVRLHRFREPDHTNVAAPTVKLATALGILALRHLPLGPAQVTDDRSSFAYRVGRARHGKLYTVLDAGAGYDSWRELGACTRPEVTVLYAPADRGHDEMPADDPAVRSVVCDVGYDAVGYRLYLRAVSGGKVELSVGPPGGRPDADAPCWSIDLGSGAAEAVGR
jgi:hypothetical protein